MDRACNMCGERKDTYSVWVENLRERDHLDDLVVRGKIIWKLIFKNLDGGHGLD